MTHPKQSRAIQDAQMMNAGAAIEHDQLIEAEAKAAAYKEMAVEAIGKLAELAGAEQQPYRLRAVPGEE